MPPPDDSRWSSGYLSGQPLLFYPAPMRTPTIHRLLPFLLACILLAQTVIAAAGWHLDSPPATHNHAAEHCTAMQQHWNTHHGGEQATAGEHHHCCHGNASGVAVPVAALLLPPTEPAALISAFSAESYRNPLADLLIRPPIA